MVRRALMVFDSRLACCVRRLSNAHLIAEAWVHAAAYPTHRNTTRCWQAQSGATSISLPKARPCCGSPHLGSSKYSLGTSAETTEAEAWTHEQAITSKPRGR